MIVSIQHFTANGTWFKPGNATFVDVILAGATAAWSSGHRRGSGLSEVIAQRYPADELPLEVFVEIGRGGRPGGEDGYAIVISHAGTPATDQEANPA